MKKQLFSFVMMLALVIVAGTAMAQKNNTPYQGGTYDYSLNGIVVHADGNAKIEYVGTAPTGWTIDAVMGETANTTYTMGDNIPILAAGGAKTLIFKIIYSDVATEGKIKVTVTDGAFGSCYNFIELSIKPVAKPALALAVAGSLDDLCQKKKDSPLTDNTDAVSDGGTANTNTFKFTVTPTVTNVTNSAPFSYEYAISIDDLSSIFTEGYTISPAIGTISHPNVTTATPDEFTITFVTKPGIEPQEVKTALSGAKLTVTNTSGTVVSTGTYGTDDVNKTDKVKINAMPAIGSFTIQ